MQFRPHALPRWQLSRASARGHSHVDAQIPNQDFFEVVTSADGEVIAAVVSDGAGTARHAEVGAQVTCQMLAPALLDLGLRTGGALSLESFRQFVIDEVEKIRAILAVEDPLHHFHCTLVLCLLTDRAGFLAQVGDSISLTTRFGVRQVDELEVLDFFPDDQVRMFEPDRGEYANETHFITQTGWTDHLRVRVFDPQHLDALLLMTDGAMDVALRRGKPFRGFLANLVGNLVGMDQASERDELLSEWLEDPRTATVTADDKTLFLAIPSRHRELAGKPFLDFDPADDVPAPAVPLHLKKPPRKPVRWWQTMGPRDQLALAASVTCVTVGISLFMLAWFRPQVAFRTHEPLRLSGDSYTMAHLQVQGGATAELTRVRVEPARSLMLVPHPGGCTARVILNRKNPECSLRIAPGPNPSGEQMLVRLSYRVSDSSPVQEVVLRLRPPREKAP